MEQKFYIAIVNREYKGESGFYTASPICTNKSDAQKFLEREYNKLKEEFSGFEDWEITKNDNAFTCIDYHNYNLWGWIEELTINSNITGHSFAYVIFSTEYIDGMDDNDGLKTKMVVTDSQSDIDKVCKTIGEITEDFKKRFPSDDYGETSDERLFKRWWKSVSFDNYDEEGELTIWFEIHDII